MQWSPRIPETAALGAIGLGLALAVVAVDTAGRILVGAAAVLLLGAAVRDLVLRPRLAARAAGVVVRTVAGPRELPWSVLRISVRTTRRLGISRRALELDTSTGPDDAGVLVLLGQRDLGADPADVAAALHGFRPREG